jgi:hypothetical protein
MGIRLELMARWTPNYLLCRELEKVSAATTNALQELVKKYAPLTKTDSIGEREPAKTLQEKRTAMARKHTALVDALVAAVGRDEAVAVGRDAMFRVGKKLGTETRDRLGVGENPRDLVKAAKILYRVLGIHFEVEWLNPTSAVLFVDRCALAKEYSDVTCLVLSATDEGVVEGLNSAMRMQFDDRIAKGCSKCNATIRLNSKGGKRN